MKILKILLLCLSLISTSIFAEGNCELPSGRYIVEPGVFVEITENQFKLSYDFEEWYLPKIDGIYSVYEKDRYKFLDVKDKSGKSYEFSYSNIDDVIIFHYLESDFIFCSSITITKGQFSKLSYYYTFNSSSYLVESYSGKTFRYYSDNLKNWRLYSPWVEGVEGDGTGEWISFSYNYPSSSFYIFNGFYDPNRPALFSRNNRIKKLRIEASITNDGNEKLFSHDFDLIDTPQIQKIVLPEGYTNFKLYIIGVYEGSEFDDTCLSGIFTDRRFGK